MSEDSRVPSRRALTGGDFARQFGVPFGSLSNAVLKMIAAGDWRYHRLNRQLRDSIMLNIAKTIMSNTLTSTGQKDRWDKGWSENLAEFVRTGGLDSLIPKYIKDGQPIHLYKDFAMSFNRKFGLDWYRVFRRWLFETWLEPYDTVYEFGCGTGHNLAAFAQWDSSKRYVGLDWSAPALAMVDAVGRQLGVDMIGVRFDFFEPNHMPNLKGSAVLTIGALEQTGSNYRPFIEFLVRHKPGICVHVEPIIEWYDEANLVDWLAIQYLRKRNYWEGFPALMSQLEAEGQAEIIHRKRTEVGSLYVEGYMVFVWRPT